MDTMAEKGEVTKQQVNDSSSMPEEIVIQTRSDGQTASTTYPTSDLNKEKKTGVELKTDYLKSNDRESDIILGGDQRSNETSSGKCYNEDTNTKIHELTKVIQQLTDSITRLNVQQAIRDDETESMKKQITDNNKRIEREINDMLTTRFDDETESIKQQITDNNRRIEREVSDMLTTRFDRIDDELTEVQKENKAKTSVCDFIKGFAESSTIHGLPRLAAKGWIWRIFWSILLLGALVISTLQIADLFKDYFKYPVNMDVKFHFDYPRYPQITVCKSQPFKSSAVMLHPVSRNYSYAQQLENDIKDLPEKERIKLGYEASEMVYGRFTSENGTYPLKPTLFHDRKWGNCYTFTPPYGTKIVFIAINLNLKERLDNNDSVLGYVFLAQVGLYPLDLKHALLIKPNTEVRSTFQVEEVSKLNGMYGGCQDDEDIFKKRTGFAYTQSLCLEECRLKNSQLKCDCIIHFLQPGFKNPEVSNSRTCATVKELKCSRQAYLSPMNCQCKPMCRRSVYSIRAQKYEMQDDPSYFDFIHDIFFNSSCNNCTDLAQTNYASFVLSVVGKHYKEFKQKPLYPLPRFLSDIGGTLGLYIGASALSLFELIHMLSGLILFLLKRRRTE